MTDTIPGPEDDVWHNAVSLLGNGLGVYPERFLDPVRFCGLGVANTAVHTTADAVHLRITHGGPAPVAVWDLAMPPAFARYLAALLDAHARYVQSATR